ncbi:hypothetical protein ACN6Q1_19190, partial [Acinetobacter baumannii]
PANPEHVGSLVGSEMCIRDSSGGKRTRTIMHEEKNRPDLREKLSIRKDSKLNQPAIKSVTLKLSACSHENGNNN